MKKVLIHRPGGFERLQIVEAPTPALEPGTVRVATRSAGVNFADCVVRMGLYESAAKYVGWPITPGFEFSGVVTEVAPDVRSFALGAEVMGVVRFGAQATELVVPARQLHPLPPGCDLVDAGALLVTFLTAWYALREACKLRPGMRVLVHSGAGGVGLAALQIARARDCVPVAVVGQAHKAEIARRFGAEIVIDKSSEPLFEAARRAAPDGYDVVLDPNGSETLRQSYDCLRPMGRLVVYGFGTMLERGRGTPNWPKLAWSFLRTPRFNPLRLTNDNKAVMAFNLSYLFDSLHIFDEALSDLSAWFTRGAYRPLPVRAFPLEAVADAQRELQSGSTTGKLTLTCEPGTASVGIEAAMREPPAAAR